MEYGNKDPRMGEMADWLTFVNTENVRKAGYGGMVSLADEWGLGDLFKAPAQQPTTFNTGKIVLIAAAGITGVLLFLAVRKKRR